MLSRLYAICDADVCEAAGWALADFAAACMDGGATLLQLRAKHTTSGAFLACAEQVVRRAEASGATVIINDRADIVRLSGAHGVHVGQDDLAPALARAVVGDAALVGLSTHTPEQLRAGAMEPVSYLAIGPVFGTATKDTGYCSVGLDLVRDARAIAAVRGLPVVAIGGMTLERAPEVIVAGAASVAVISDLLVTGKPAERVRDYLSRLARV